MNDREEWRERVRDIRATSATWWWWSENNDIGWFNFNYPIEKTYNAPFHSTAFKKHSCPTTELWKILTENTTILQHQNKMQKQQILTALNIRNLLSKLNRITFQTSANVLKCLWVLTLFVETNSKSKRYTIHQYRSSSYKVIMYLQKLHHFSNTSSPDDGPKSGRSYLEITNYGRFINQFQPNNIKSIRQFERINEKYVDKKCLLCSIKYVFMKK